MKARQAHIERLKAAFDKQFPAVKIIKRRVCKGTPHEMTVQYPMYRAFRQDGSVVYVTVPQD